jgi:cellulose synthase (UDP-forming)
MKPPAASFWDRPVAIALVVVGTLLALGLFSLVRLDSTGEEAQSLVLVGVGLLSLWLFPEYRIAAMLISAAGSTRYYLWRLTDTLALEGIPRFNAEGRLQWALAEVPDTLISVALLLAEGYAFFVLMGGYFQTAVHRERSPVPIDIHDPALPTVDILVPCYTEGTEILRRTLIGALQIQYPNKKIFLLDDSRVEEEDHPGHPEEAERHRALRREREQLCRELGVTRICRDLHPHAKAGNLNYALRRTQGELVAFFDADHVPVSSFLQTTVGFFQDPTVALVQTPHHFYNADAFERNLYLEGRAPAEQMLFYHLIQKGNDFWNSAFFCGSCAVIRRKALESVGGIATETVTEDAHTSLKMHAKGWRSVYLDIPQAAGLATESFAAHLTQRSRWAIGMSQILRVDNPLFKRGLSLAQRMNYTLSASHFLFGIPRIIYLLAPVAYLLLGLNPLLCSLRDILVFAGPHLILSLMTASVTHRNTRHSFWPEVHQTALAAWTAVVTTAALFGFPFRFHVTPKGLHREHRSFDWRSSGPVLVFLALSVASLVICPYLILSRPEQLDTILIAETWNLYNLALLGAAVTVSLERPERRVTVRLAIQARGWVRAEERPDPPSTPGLPDAPPRIYSWVPFEEGEAFSDHGSEESPAATSSLPVRVEDLSEGGARLHFPTVTELPRRIWLTISTPDGLEVTLPATLRIRYPTREGMAVGVAFDALEPAAQRVVIAMMFTDPRRWLDTRFERDHVVESAARVITAPLVSFFFHRWAARRQQQLGTALVDPSSLGPSTSKIPLLVGPNRPGLGVAALGLSCLVGGMALQGGWVGQNPTLAGWTVRDGQQVASLSRKEELRAAYEGLRELRWQAWTATLPLSRGLPGTWEKHLWSIRFHLGLRADAPLPAEPLLYEITGRLFQIRQAMDAGASGQELRSSLAEVQEALDRVEGLLGEGG